MLPERSRPTREQIGGSVIAPGKAIAAVVVRFKREYGSKEMSGWTYVAEAVGQNLFKIGFTTTEDPDDRLRSLQIGCPHKLELLIAFHSPTPREFEVALQGAARVGIRHVHGEWFACPREEMLDAMMHFFAGVVDSLGIMKVRSSSIRRP